MANPLRKLAEKLHFGMEKVTPDSLIFAVILTFIVFIMAIVVVNAGPLQIVAAWHKGFWAYLGFSMQMVVLLIFGFAVATSRPPWYPTPNQDPLTCSIHTETTTIPPQLRVYRGRRYAESLSDRSFSPGFRDSERLAP